MSDVVMNVIEIDVESEQFAISEGEGDVRRLHESKLHLDMEEAVPSRSTE